MNSAYKNKGLIERLGFACRGLIQCWREENSFRFQTLAAFGVIIILLILRPPLIWAALLILVSSLVLCAELFNSALERLVSKLSSTPSPEIKAVKDMAAGAVLVLASTAVVLGCFLLFFMLSETA
ncbi:MAG: diacylglycerol kinase [Pseudomonadota bacterium]|nr:diacylglycerol kinase [Pseudomonadota bacterium]